MKNDDRMHRDVHVLDDEGMVLCNPRDKEASHRAAMGDIAIGEGNEVTCRKCLARQRSLRNNEQSGETEPSPAPPNEELSEGLAQPAPFVRIRGLASMAAEYRAGDGVDPKEEKRDKLRSQRKKKVDHSTERLASQILDALSFSTILSEIGLDDFVFDAVHALASGGQFMVEVRCQDNNREFDPYEIEQQLKSAAGRFRHEISGFVHRRRVPELKFRVLPAG